MSQIGAPLVGFYDLRLVALSAFIAISASYAALDLGGRVTASRGWIRSAWLAGGATAMGFGIWSTHFTGMLGFSLPITVAYHWPTVLLSLAFAIFASAIALYVVSRKKMGRVQALTGSALMGLGIVGMHYIGMAAMRLSATCHYSPLLVTFSVLIAIAASLVALVFTFGYREDFKGTTLAKVMSATAMGAAISLMHYSGMMSASFSPSAVLPDMSRAVSISSLGLSGIAIGTLVVQGIAILTSSVDRRFAIQAQELQTSERFRQIAGILRDVLLLSNADFSEILFVNNAYEAIWGRTVESLYADPRSWLEGVHPDDRQRVEEAEQRVVGGEPFDYLECRIVRPAGSIAWVRLRAYPVVDAQGHLYRIVGTAHEFTKRKLAEEQVKRGETYLAMAQRLAQMGVWSWNPSSGDMFGSQEFCSIFGIDPAETKLTREMFLQRIHPEDRPRFESEVNAAVAERRNGELDYRIVLPDASVKYVHAIGKPIFDKSGDILEFVGTTLDITERKRAEQELRQAEEHIRAILEYSPNWIFLKDTEGRYLLVNREIERVFGISQEQIKGKTDTEIFPPEQAAEYRANDLKVLRAGVTMEFEEIALMEDGRHTSIVHKFPLFDAHGNIYAIGGVATDITERKRAEEELRRLSGQLLRLQDEERRKIARDLHDSTGQDLVALATMLGQLSDSIPSVERKPHRLLSECKALADKCIRDVRTLSYVLHPPVLDQAGLEDAIRDYVEGFTKRSGIQVELVLSSRLGRMERDIELALFRVVQESLTNIQRHSGSQRATIRIHRDSDLTLEISDLGPGLSAPVPRRKKELRFDVGVGIPSMHERVRLVGGRLEIDSTSHGTTVRVTIPLGGERT
jgi:PAS domain S-box-containing protein